MRISIRNKNIVIFRTGTFHIYPKSATGFMSMVRDFWRSK